MLRLFETSCPRSIAALLGSLVIAIAAPILAEPAGDLGLAFEARSFAAKATPPLPPVAVFPIQLVLDDDGPEGVFGFFGGTARQFLWFNRFANPGPFTLEEIWVLFPAGMDAPLNGAVQLAVYLDPDGDPANGAQFLASYDMTIQAVDGNTFSVYPISPALVVDGPGDVLIGAINRFFETGVDPPPTEPAAVDTTANQNRSYFALWTADPPDPPNLASASSISLIARGNFMIRAFGAPISAPITDIPTLAGYGLALLMALIGVAGALLARRRSSAG